MRRELSLPAPSVRPADTVASAQAPATGRRSVDDPAALDGLLALPNVHLIVDGYNVTKTGYGDLALADQRDPAGRRAGRLAAPLREPRSRSRFDGGRRPPSMPRVPARRPGAVQPDR